MNKDIIANTKITVIGGANIDLYGKSYSQLISKTSNPGELKISSGGVGRNIAENLARVGLPTSLITALARDIYGDLLIKHNTESAIDMEKALILDQGSTGCYMALLNNDGDMEIALSSMGILEALDLEAIRERQQFILESSIIVLDTNIPKETIEYVAELGEQHNIPVFIDMVSTEKSKKTKAVLEKFYAIKANRLEIEEIIGFKLKSETDFEVACSVLHQSGIKRIIITLGKDGYYFWDKDNHGLRSIEDADVVNASGAGDAFMAGLVLGTVLNKSLEQCCKIGFNWSKLTISTHDTVYRDISIDKLL